MTSTKCSLRSPTTSSYGIVIAGLLLTVAVGSGLLVQRVPQTAQAQSQGLLQGFGLAAKYPGDAGIERDPSVVFTENFEVGSIEEMGKRWGEISNKDGKVMAFSDDVPPDSAGKRSLQMTGTFGENSGGHLYHKPKALVRLPNTVFKRGLDKVFLRFYTKFADDHAYEHHFVSLFLYFRLPPSDFLIAVFIDLIGWYGR